MTVAPTALPFCFGKRAFLFWQVVGTGRNEVLRKLEKRTMRIYTSLSEPCSCVRLGRSAGWLGKICLTEQCFVHACASGGRQVYPVSGHTMSGCQAVRQGGPENGQARPWRL